MSRSHLAHFFVASVIAVVLVATAVSAPAQTYTDLHDFNGSAGDPTNFNSGRLAQARDGNFYAESRAGGTSSLGTVFNVSPTSGAVSIILSFDGTNGSQESGGLTLGPSDGQLYGDAISGGTSGDGVTFKVTTNGTFTPLHNFTNSGDGENPVNALVVGSNGNFYGMTPGPETFYEVTSAGKLTTLQTFTSADGYQGGQLTLGSDGNFYGGLNLGGANGTGTLFKVTPSGTVTVLHNFAGNSSDGADAAWGMVEAPNGLFFGTPYAGGANGAGTLFKVTSSGTFALLQSFTAATDGSGPGGLTLATDGNMYGDQ